MIPRTLILVHSFPTNSILLAGLGEFLGEHFDLHFVDLPGFTRQVPPIHHVSIASFASFLEERIRQIDVDRYVLGGISFGHLVVSHTRVDARCRAILALEPFLGEESLTMSRWQRLLFKIVIGCVTTLGLASRVWESAYFRKRLLRRGEPARRIDTVLREIDPRTFFATAGLIVGYRGTARFHPLPHVLMINPKDQTIRAEAVMQTFRSAVEDLLVVETEVDHYPTEMTREYFSARISPVQMAAVFRFLDEKAL